MVLVVVFSKENGDVVPALCDLRGLCGEAYGAGGHPNTA